jgi:hypothetical protein
LHRAASLLLLTSLLLTLSGCYWNIPVADLLSPPMLTQEQTAIFEALTNAEGTALTLKYPKSGEFLSAFVFFPDNADRVMVFHEQSGAFAEATIRLTFLERGSPRTNGGWEVTHSLSFFATGIEQVEFAALGDCERQNIVISTSITGSDRNLHVIAFCEESGAPLRVFERGFCIFYQIGDWSNSGSNTLLSINSSGSELADESLVWFSGWEDGEFSWFLYPYAIHANAPAASDNFRAISGFVGESDAQIPALFIEYSMSPAESNTCIILWLDGIPRNVITAAERWQLTKNPNRFTAHASARDIDGSGTINPARNRQFPGYGEIPPAEIMRAAVWYEVAANGSNLREIYYTYLSVNNDFVFFFPENWVESVTATLRNEPSANVVNEVTFWEWNPPHHTSVLDVTTPLLTIVTVAKGEELSRDEYGDNDEFFRFSGESLQYDYFARIHGQSLTRAQLQAALRFH